MGWLTLDGLEDLRPVHPDEQRERNRLANIPVGAMTARDWERTRELSILDSDRRLAGELYEAGGKLLIWFRVSVVVTIAALLALVYLRWGG